VTAASPERAMYDKAADLWAAGVIGAPSIHWEEMTRDERDGWARVRLAGARAETAAAPRAAPPVPLPAPGSAGITWELERYLAVTGIRCQVAGDDQAAGLAAAALHLLEWLRRARPEVAALKAREITAALNDGTCGDFLLRDGAAVGIDAEETARAAEAGHGRPAGGG
jgi:hypothetical protein